MKCDNGKANTTASDVSEAKTIFQYVTKSPRLTYIGRVEHPIYSNSGEVKCGYLPKNGINIATPCVNVYSVTVAPAKSETPGCFRQQLVLLPMWAVT